MTTKYAHDDVRNDVTPPPPKRPPRFGLSATQLVATALAGGTATVAASFLGVSGTVIGAALVSVVSAIGNAVYGQSLRNTRDRVRSAVPPLRRTSTLPASLPPAPASTGSPVAGGDGPPGDTTLHGRPGVWSRTRRRWRAWAPWKRIAAGAVAMFVFVLALVTVIEGAAGRPLSDLLRGDSGSGTTVFGHHGGSSSGPGSTPSGTTPTAPATSPGASAVTSTAPTVTQTVTTSPTDSASTTAGTTRSASASRSASGSATATRSGSVSPNATRTSGHRADP